MIASRQVSLASLFLLASLVVPAPTVGDVWMSPESKTYSSASGGQCFEVKPDKDWPRSVGKCIGTLYRCTGAKKEVVWSRFLINNQSPVKVVVPGYGDYVVTMDEWGAVGKLPLVLYGKGGQLIYVHNLESLDLLKDLGRGKIDMTVGSLLWNQDAVTVCVPDEEVLVVRLHWGRMLFLDLRHGYILTAERSIFRERYERSLAYASRELPNVALKLLESKLPEELKAGAMLSGQLKVHAAIPLLRKLLANAHWQTITTDSRTRKVYYVRQAAKEALEAMGQNTAGVVVEEPVPVK